MFIYYIFIIIILKYLVCPLLHFTQNITLFATSKHYGVELKIELATENMQIVARKYFFNIF